MHNTSIEYRKKNERIFCYLYTLDGKIDLYTAGTLHGCSPNKGKIMCNA